MYEHRAQPLLEPRQFAVRLLTQGGLAAAVLGSSLALGATGYHLTQGLPWLDSVLNAAMILSGMGPVDKLTTVSAKLFASFYALFSGVVFIAVAGLLLAPVVHRVLHRLHLDLPDR